MIQEEERLANAWAILFPGSFLNCVPMHMDSFSNFLFLWGHEWISAPYWKLCIGPRRSGVSGQGRQVCSALCAAATFPWLSSGFPAVPSHHSWGEPISSLCSGFSFLPLAFHFSSFFSASSVFLPLNCPGLWGFDILHGWLLSASEILLSWVGTVIWGRNGYLVPSVTFKIWIFPECSLPEAFGEIFRFAAVVENRGCQMSE